LYHSNLQDLLKKVTVNHRLIERIITEFQRFKAMQPKEQAYIGYMGHLARIIIVIDDTIKKQPGIIETLDFGVKETWGELAVEIAKKIEQELSPLGGPKPINVGRNDMSSFGSFSSVGMGHSGSSMMQMMQMMQMMEQSREGSGESNFLMDALNGNFEQDEDEMSRSDNNYEVWQDWHTRKASNIEEVEDDIDYFVKPKFSSEQGNNENQGWADFGNDNDRTRNNQDNWSHMSRHPEEAFDTSDNVMQ